MGCFRPFLLGGWPGGLRVVFCGPMGCCFSGVIAFIGIAASLIFFADVLRFRVTSNGRCCDSGDCGNSEGAVSRGSWWAAWFPSWVAHSGEGAWHSARLILGFFRASVPVLF